LVINERIRVLIAEQQPMFRRGITSVLTRETDIELVGEAVNAAEVMDKLNTLVPSILLLDITISPNSGLDLARNIKQLYPSISVIILTPQSSNEELFDVIKVHAAGYLERDVNPEELLSNIRKCASGVYPINDTFVSHPEVAQQVLEKFQELSWGKELEQYVSPLTPRETEILNYMAQGYFNKQIAQTLSISEQTIKNHITSILRKLDANARTEAVIKAISIGLINIPNMKNSS
jgi:two-component system, NarL family, response regulator DegU